NDTSSSAPSTRAGTDTTWYASSDPTASIAYVSGRGVAVMAVTRNCGGPIFAGAPAGASDFEQPAKASDDSNVSTANDFPGTQEDGRKPGKRSDEQERGCECASCSPILRLPLSWIRLSSSWLPGTPFRSP